MSYSKQTKNKLFPFHPPIEFPCFVAGERLCAAVTHLEDNYIQYIYHIQFSDGYRSSFLTDEESGKWIDLSATRLTAKKIKPYVEGITTDLNAIIAVTPGTRILCFQLSEKEGINIWIRESGEPNMYTVHYEGDYQFHLRKTLFGWETKTVRHGRTLDEAMAAAVTKKMEGLFQEKAKGDRELARAVDALVEKEMNPQLQDGQNE